MNDAETTTLGKFKQQQALATKTHKIHKGPNIKLPLR